MYVCMYISICTYLYIHTVTYMCIYVYIYLYQEESKVLGYVEMNIQSSEAGLCQLLIIKSTSFPSSIHKSTKVCSPGRVAN